MTAAILILESLPGQIGLPTDVPNRFPLGENQENRLGRNPDCAVFLDYDSFQMVSRYHAAIQAFPARRGRPHRVWQVRDLGSANGTYINGQHLEESHWLQTGDRLQLGSTGPCFRFELVSERSLVDRFASLDPPSSQASPHAPGPASAQLGSHPIETPPDLTVSQLFPLVSAGADFVHKSLFIPGVLTVSLAVSLFAAFGHPLTFNRILALYLGFAGYYFFIYRLCGKPKPGWLLGLVAIATALILQSPITTVSLWLFREVLPGSLPEPGQAIGHWQRFGRLFIGTGLMEEGLKALPVVLCGAIAQQLPQPWRDRVGIREPLDGILLGAASGVGFTLVETLGQYVPQIMAQVSELDGLEAGQLAGLQLLIPRLLGSIAGHMAYSGYLGYFLGLSVLQPRQRVPIVLVGYLSAAFLHTLWNWAGLTSALLLTVAGLLSYFVLMGAILKARALSPTRAHNFATNLHIPSQPSKRVP